MSFSETRTSTAVYWNLLEKGVMEAKGHVNLTPSLPRELAIQSRVSLLKIWFFRVAGWPLRGRDVTARCTISSGTVIDQAKLALNKMLQRPDNSEIFLLALIKTGVSVAGGM